MSEAANSDYDFKRLLLGSIPSLRAFALSLCGVPDRADDLLQETIMKAWAKQESFEAGTNIKAWLFTILRNEFYSQMRKRGREIGDPDDIYTSKMAVQPNQHGAMDMEDFKKALAELSDDQREAIILVSASGFSYDEAAEICGCAVGTIKSRINRARARLQEILDISGEGDFGPDASTAAIVNVSAVS